MTEMTQGLLATAAWFAVAIFATLYWYGGRDKTSKAWRRIAGGLLIAVATLVLAQVNGTFSLWMLPALVTLPAALSIGYGGESKWEKIFKRGLFGVAVSANSLWFAIPLGMLGVGMFQIMLGLGASVYFGTWNPFNNAAKEEAVIGGLSVLLIPFIV